VQDIMAAESFDVVVVHLFRMAPFVYAAAHPAKVLLQEDSMGIVLGQSIPFSPWWKRPGIAWERWRVNRYMAPCSHHFRETWAVSPGDQRDLIRLGAARVELVRHGVDERLFDLERKPASEPRLMFLGNLSVFHNIDAASFAAREIWPSIHGEWPNARLILAGADPVPEITQLASIEGVEVTGRIPNLTDLWQSAHVFVAPIRFATGIQNKLLEAMAAGVPIVSTTSVAEALGARHDEHMLLGDTADELAQAVANVIRDPGAARLRAERAREFVRRSFTWDMQVRRLEALTGESSPSRVPAVSAVGE